GGRPCAVPARRAGTCATGGNGGTGVEVVSPATSGGGSAGGSGGGVVERYGGRIVFRCSRVATSRRSEAGGRQGTRERGQGARGSKPGEKGARGSGASPAGQGDRSRGAAERFRHCPDLRRRCRL